MALQRKYIYKVFRNGAFLGVLQNVVTPFETTQNINTAAAQLAFDVESSAFTGQQTVTNIETELGAVLQAEDGSSLTIERTPDLVGSNNSNALIRNGNDIQVFEYSDTYPNGTQVFGGYISKWKAVFGGSDNVHVTCLSYAADLDNYITKVGGYTIDTDTSGAAASGVWTFSTNGPSETYAVGQTFQVTTAGQLAKLSVKLFGNYDVSIERSTINFEVGRGTPIAPIEVLASGSFVRSYNVPTGPDFTDFAFTPFPVVTGTTYYFTLVASVIPPDFTPGFYIYYLDSAASYAFGAQFTNDIGFGWESFPSPPYNSLTFKSYLSGGSVNATFTSRDPSDIVRDIIDDYRGQGGVVSYTAASVSSTGISVNYALKLNTPLEGIQKALSAAPANWYWYVDLGTNVLYFKQISTTADFKLTLGRDIMELDVEATIEDLKNVAYLSGGDTGAGQNLLLSDTDTASIAAGDRKGLARLSDNRQTNVASGRLILDSFLGENAAEKYLTSVRLRVDGNIDTTLIKPGKTIGFAGGSNFIDNLVLQVVSIHKTPEFVDLKLGLIPKRASAKLEASQRYLVELQTVDNPSTPS